MTFHVYYVDYLLTVDLWITKSFVCARWPDGYLSWGVGVDTQSELNTKHPVSRTLDVARTKHVYHRSSL